MTRIVVVGDKLTDRYIHGKRHECQDGCWKFIRDATDCVEVPGGAANAARSLCHSGSFVEEFYAGEEEVKIRYMEDGRCVFRIDQRGKDQRHYQTYRRNMMDWLSAKRFGGLYISDYNKGFLTDELIAEIIKLCNERKVPVVVDPKRAPECCKGAIIKCNEDYWMLHFQGDVTPCDIDKLVVTRGSKPPYFFERCVTLGFAGALGFAGGPPVELVSHIGAGDCFGAWLTLGLARGMTLTDAVRQADAAGRVYVQWPHNRPPHPHEVAEELSRMYTADSHKGAMA